MNEARRPQLQRFSAAIMNAERELNLAQASMRQFTRNHPSYAAAALRVSTAERRLHGLRSEANVAKSQFINAHKGV